MQILVVGAGPTGLTAAVELVRRGASVKLIEKRTSGSGLSRAVGILPESLKLLEPSGVTEKLLAEGSKLTSMKFFLGDKPALVLDLLQNQAEREFLLALAQDRTEAILRDRLEALGGKLEFGVELKSLEQTENGVHAIFTDGSSGRFQKIIGADGINSTTRTLCGLKFAGFELPQTWSIADVEAKNWPHNGSFVVCRMGDGQVAVVAQLDQNRYRVISNTEDSLQTLPLELQITRIRRQGTFNISVRQVDEYQKGNVFLAGDAAHCHSPVGGRGMNLGISDAVELARRITEGSEENYSSARHRHGRSVIALSERGRKLITSNSLLTSAAVNVLFAIARRSPLLRKKMANIILYG